MCIFVCDRSFLAGMDADDSRVRRDTVVPGTTHQRLQVQCSLHRRGDGRWSGSVSSKNLALNIRDWVSLVGRGISVVGAPPQNLGTFIYPYCLCVSDGTL